MNQYMLLSQELLITGSQQDKELVPEYKSTASLSTQFKGTKRESHGCFMETHYIA
jgi:hypothetical protein